MNGDQDAANRANTRLDHINGDITEIKLDLKETKDLVHETCLQVESLKTEVRIVGGMFLAIVTAILVAVIGGFI